jgi:hypothetical protein
MKSFLKKAVATSIVLTAGSMILDNMMNDLNLGMFTWLVPAFFLIITGITYYFIFSGKKGKQGSFFARVVGSMVLRIILCLIFITIYLYIYKLNHVSVVVYFMVAYFIYTTFEIYDLVSKLRAEKFNGENA